MTPLEIVLVSIWGVGAFILLIAFTASFFEDLVTGSERNRKYGSTLGSTISVLEAALIITTWPAFFVLAYFGSLIDDLRKLISKK